MCIYTHYISVDYNLARERGEMIDWLVAEVDCHRSKELIDNGGKRLIKIAQVRGWLMQSKRIDWLVTEVNCSVINSACFLLYYDFKQVEYFQPIIQHFIIIIENSMGHFVFQSSTTHCILITQYITLTIILIPQIVFQTTTIIISTIITMINFLQFSARNYPNCSTKKH